MKARAIMLLLALVLLTGCSRKQYHNLPTGLECTETKKYGNDNS